MVWDTISANSSRKVKSQRRLPGSIHELTGSIADSVVEHEGVGHGVNDGAGFEFAGRFHFVDRCFSDCLDGFLLGKDS